LLWNQACDGSLEDERVREAFAALLRERQLSPDDDAVNCIWRQHPQAPKATDHGTHASTLAAQGYRLTIEPTGITVEAGGAAGAFYAVQTLRQWVMAHEDAEGLPCGVIEDQPRFAWRGSMIDSARHFQPLSWILRHLDRMAALKLNRFHWHLCDDQGWRPEIRRYPQLVEKAAWRGRGEDRHGGFYTQNQMRQVVEYARKRFITVIPEIEMPGHCNAALIAFPHLSCTGEALPIADAGWDAFTRLAGRRAFCAANDQVQRFLQDVLGEINAVFDPPYLHLGGDETPRNQWDACPRCADRMRQLQPPDSRGLRIQFLRRMHDFCRKSLGKPTIAWTDGVSAELPRDQIVHAWHPGEAVAAAKLGYRVIDSCHESTYLDYPATAQDAVSKPDWMIVLPLEKVYAFDPLPAELAGELGEHMLGGEAPLWTEHCPDEASREHQLMPRLAAFAEALWSPVQRRDFNGFRDRLALHRPLGTLGLQVEPAGDALHWA
jgi:hexosaminidase